jgi:hypothetical protein
MDAKKFTIVHTGKTMNDFPQDPYNRYSPYSPAYEVLDQNGASRFVGPYVSCENFIQWYYQR